MDNQVTQEQFDRMLNTFLPAIDVSYPRIKTALDTGSDPGNQDPQLAAAQALGSASAGIPPELRELLDKLKKKDSGKPTDGPTTGEKPEIKEI
jgi:hypothetical protein